MWLLDFSGGNMIDTVKIKNVATYCDDNEEIVASKN